MKQTIVLAALVLLAGTAAAFETEDPPLPPPLGGPAEATVRRPTDIAGARAMALQSRCDPAETKALLEEMSADVRGGEMLRRAADNAEILGLPALVRLMEIARKSDSVRVQSDAYYATWEVTPRVFRTPTGVRALGDMLTWLENAPDDDEAISNMGAGLRPAMKSAGPAATPLLPRLVELSGHERPAVRRLAVQSIAYLGRFARSATPVMIRALDDTDPETRITALYALGSNVYVGDDLQARLDAAQGDADRDVRHAAKLTANHHRLVARDRARQRSRPPEYPELRDGDHYWGPVFPEDAGPETGDGEVVEEAPVKDEPKKTFPTDVDGLVTALDDPDLRDAAEARLTELGPLAADALPRLILHLDDSNRTRAPTIRLLAAIGGDRPEIIAELVAVMDGLCRQHRLSHHMPEPIEEHAAQALGRIGPKAAAALPALRLARIGGSAELSNSAAAAIRDIERTPDER